jgi:hypothetical protein
MKAHVLIAAAAAAAVGSGLAGVSSAGIGGSAFACPSDPKTQPLGKIYGKNRGSSFCSDGASARASIGTTKAIIVNFKNGVCWKSRQGLNVAVGTIVVNDRKKSDPAGLWLQDYKPGGVVGDTLSAQSGATEWSGPVKITLTKGGKSGTFSGKRPKLVNGKLTYIPISGTFTCKRILDAPNQ